MEFRRDLALGMRDLVAIDKQGHMLSIGGSVVTFHRSAEPDQIVAGARGDRHAGNLRVSAGDCQCVICCSAYLSGIRAAVFFSPIIISPPVVDLGQIQGG
jgi:hypothetical protein